MYLFRILIPKSEHRSFYPVLVVELEWNKMVQTALQQIKEKRYPESILRYTGDILFVGISYDKKEKNRSARGKIT